MGFDLKHRYISIDYGITINGYLVPIQVINHNEKYVANALAYNKHLFSPLQTKPFRTRGVFVIFRHINIYVVDLPEEVVSDSVTKNLFWSMDYVKKWKELKLDDPTIFDWLYNELVRRLPK